MNIGPEMLFLLLLAFLLFGPKRLPEMGRKLGRALAEFKRASNELKGQLENEMRQLEAEEREKKISPPAPPPPENTVTASPQSVAASPEPQLSLPMGDPQQAVAATVPAENSPPLPGPGVEGA